MCYQGFVLTEFVLKGFHCSNLFDQKCTIVLFLQNCKFSDLKSLVVINCSDDETMNYMYIR